MGKYREGRGSGKGVEKGGGVSCEERQPGTGPGNGEEAGLCRVVEM